MSNLYRIPRPRYGILFEGTYCPPGGFVEPYKLVLTHADLWLSDNLSIPLASISNIETIGDAIVRVSYANVLSNQEEAVDITAAGLLGNTNKEAVWNLANVLLTERSKTQKVDDFIAEMTQGGGGRLARCEVCGETPGAQVDLGYVVCFGLNYRSVPMRRCLCRKHAIRRCIACNVYTGICGWWGFPGAATGPQRMWDNAISVRRAFKTNVLATHSLFGVGFLFWLGVFGLFILLATTDLVKYVLE